MKTHRERIYELLYENRDKTFSSGEIVSRLEVRREQVCAMLVSLHRDGTVSRQRGQGGKFRYSLSHPERAAPELPKKDRENPAKKRVLDWVLGTTGGFSASQVGNALGLSRPQAARFLVIFFEEGVLCREKVGRKAVYCVAKNINAEAALKRTSKTRDGIAPVFWTISSIWDNAAKAAVERFKHS